MFLIDRMRLPAFFVPDIGVYGREEDVSLGGFGVNFRQTEPVGYWHCLPVDAGAAYDVDLFVATATLQGGFKGGEKLRTGA